MWAEGTSWEEWSGTDCSVCYMPVYETWVLSPQGGACLRFLTRKIFSKISALEKHGMNRMEDAKSRKGRKTIDLER